MTLASVQPIVRQVLLTPRTLDSQGQHDLALLSVKKNAPVGHRSGHLSMPEYFTLVGRDLLTRPYKTDEILRRFRNVLRTYYRIDETANEDTDGRRTFEAVLRLVNAERDVLFYAMNSLMYTDMLDRNLRTQGSPVGRHGPFALFPLIRRSRSRFGYQYADQYGTEAPRVPNQFTGAAQAHWLRITRDSFQSRDDFLAHGTPYEPIFRAFERLTSMFAVLKAADPTDPTPPRITDGINSLRASLVEANVNTMKLLRLVPHAIMAAARGPYGNRAAPITSIADWQYLALANIHNLSAGATWKEHEFLANFEIPHVDPDGINQSLLDGVVDVNGELTLRYTDPRVPTGRCVGIYDVDVPPIFDDGRLGRRRNLRHWSDRYPGVLDRFNGLLANVGAFRADGHFTSVDANIAVGILNAGELWKEAAEQYGLSDETLVLTEEMLVRPDIYRQLPGRPRHRYSSPVSSPALWNAIANPGSFITPIHGNPLHGRTVRVTRDTSFEDALVLRATDIAGRQAVGSATLTGMGHEAAVRVEFDATAAAHTEHTVEALALVVDYILSAGGASDVVVALPVPRDVRPIFAQMGFVDVDDSLVLSARDWYADKSARPDWMPTPAPTRRGRYLAGPGGGLRLSFGAPADVPTSAVRTSI